MAAIWVLSVWIGRCQSPSCLPGKLFPRVEGSRWNGLTHANVILLMDKCNILQENSFLSALSLQLLWKMDWKCDKEACLGEGYLEGKDVLSSLKLWSLLTRQERKTELTLGRQERGN